MGVIEVPYVKPIARGRRRDRIDCRIVWPAKLDARLTKRPAKVPKPASVELPAGLLAPRPVPAESSPERVAEEPPRMLPVLTTVIGGAAATCGFALGKMVAAGFVASVVGGLALLVMGAVLVAMRVSSRGRSNARGVAAVAGVLAMAVAATIGAGAVSRG